MEAGRNQDQESCFIFSKLTPSQWGDYFLSITINDSDLEFLATEMEVVKPKVRERFFMLSSEEEDAVKKNILLIHLLGSLGLAYHFEREIEETLKHAFEKMEDLINGENDLYTISIMFRAFRTYGHNMPSDVFNRFKGNDGKFKECLIDDVKGLLSLYEAVHFRTTTDHILDEALSFSLDHLEPLASGRRESPPHVLKHVQNALHIPQHRKTQVIVATEYISFYEQEEDHDETLLKLAKLNFKFLRLHYIHELKTVIMCVNKWWKGLDHVKNLPLGIRERSLESWFAALMMYFEPKFSLARIMSAKFTLAATFLDDVCDNGSVPEVESLVDCLERWDPDYMENCQSLMKTTFKLVMYVFKEFEEILKLQGRSFALENMIEEFKIFARSDLELLKWARTGHVPNFDEYIETGGAAGGVYSGIACYIMGLGEAGKKIDFEWLMSRPIVVRHIARKARLMDDIMDFEEDMNSGYTANALHYYIKQHGVTKEEAIREIQKMIGDVNKIINEECLKPTNVSRSVMLVLNFGRMLDVMCTSDDVYNHRGGKLKEYMIALLVDPINF